MRTGLLAGSVAAVVVALVSLPLRSPLDSLLNSATVVLGVLAGGLIAWFAWRALANGPHRHLYYVGSLGGGLVVATIIAAIGETQVERMISFLVALAAIAVVVGDRDIYGRRHRRDSGKTLRWGYRHQSSGRDLSRPGGGSPTDLCCGGQKRRRCDVHPRADELYVGADADSDADGRARSLCRG